MGNVILGCKVCSKEVLRSQADLRRNKSGQVYCGRDCRNLDWQGEGNPNFHHSWSDELRQAQSAKLKSQFTSGRKTWNKGLDRTDPRVERNVRHYDGNTYGHFTKGQTRIDDIWRNVLNSAGVRYGLQKIHKQKYHAEFWLRLRDEVYKRDNYTCQHCGKVNCRFEAHHKIPAKMGGGDELDNLITLCSICHKKEENNARKRIALVRDRHRKNG